MRKGTLGSGWRWLLAFAMLVFVTSGVQAQDAENSAETPPIETNEAEAIDTGADAPVLHTVASGESLTYIASLYETSVDKLLFLNNLDTNAVLFVGQDILVSGYVPDLPAGATLLVNDALLNAPNLPPVPKVHTVQSGETLTSIAAGYGVSIEAINIANGFDSETLLQVGNGLTVPGVAGELVAFDYAVQVGDTLGSISAEFNTRPHLLFADKLLLNSKRLIAGQRLPIISRTGSAQSVPQTGLVHVVQAGDTLLSIASMHKLPPLTLAAENEMIYPTHLFAGQRLRIPSAEPYRNFAGAWETIEVSEAALTQGEAFSIFVQNNSGNDIWGRIVQLSAENDAPAYSQDFPFAPFNDGLVAIVGLDAFTPAGLYALELYDGSENPSFRQAMQLLDGAYGTQQITISAEIATLLAPEIRAADDAQLSPIYSNFDPAPKWDTSQPLRSPLDSLYTSAAYGAARSYNGGPYSIFHTGVDYSAPVDTPILSVANGVVVFSGLTNLRGNLVLVDHGLGVVSAYFHMTTLLVQVGDVVERGQALGSLGATGLVSGAHLHWDLRVRDVAVNGAQWLEKAFP